MSRKSRSIKGAAIASVGAGAMALMAPAAGAAVTPIFEANFPASWNGTSTTVTDQSAAGNVGFQSGTTHATYTTAVVPPLAPAGTGSMALDGSAGIKVTPAAGNPSPILNNAAVGAAGGFQYDIEFMWDGTDTSASFGGVEKLIDYAGTESLQLVVPSGAGSASLAGAFTNDTGTTTTAVSTTILPNTWYDATLRLDNASLVGGDVVGTANLYLDGVLVDSAPATKGTYGDSLNRPIGIGEFGYGHNTSIIGLHGDVYSASISLVPEPSAVALASLGAVGLLKRRRARKA